MNIIKNEDCLLGIKDIKKNTVDLILTDPPYFITKKSNFELGGTAADKFIKMTHDFGEWDKDPSAIPLLELFQQYYRVLRMGGTLIIFFDIWKSNEIKEAADAVGFKQPRVCQWVKNNPTPINSKFNYLSNGIEYFFTFVKYRKGTFNSKYDHGIYHYPICHGKERTIHPTQKPLKLISDLIKKHSNEGDLVLDTFGGSGTTAESCVHLNRNYILYESNTEYYEISVKRIENI
jgi:site-specific DNA-methyltransferase (adenine-specific)